MRTSRVERDNFFEGYITLTLEESQTINDARDLWAAINARMEELRQKNCTRAYLVDGDEETQLFGPLTDFIRSSGTPRS